MQVVTYRLAGGSGDVSEADFIEADQEFAEAMAAVSGLLAKIWLKDADDEVHGGLYLWQDRTACERFPASELWASVEGDETVTDLASHDSAVMEELTKATQPGLQLL